MNKRRCGILLHITSLPSPHGVRDFGDTACKFVDFLAETRQCLWRWFKKEAGTEDKKRIHKYLGREVSEDDIHCEIIRLAMMSVANMVVIPMQDILGLGEESRMNLPATSENNWTWRLLPEQITPALIKELTETTVIYGRG